MSKETGGPAFPHQELEYFGGDYSLKSKQAGMTLRDYLVAHAPITVEDAMLAAHLDVHSVAMLSTEQRENVFRFLALLRNEYADAMLEARP